MLYPIGWTVRLSLNSDKTALRGGVDFVGLANYLRIIRNPDFAVALAQTLGFLAASFALEAVLGLTVALALHSGLAGAQTFRAIVSLPLRGAAHRAFRSRSGRWRIAMANSDPHHIAAVEAGYRYHRRYPIGRRVPHFRRRLHPDGERPRQPDGRAFDFHLPADVHGFRFRRRGSRINPSGD